MNKTIYYRTVELIYKDKDETELSVEVRHAFTYPEDGDKWIKEILSSDGQSILNETMGMLLCEGDKFLEFGDVQDIIVDLD